MISRISKFRREIMGMAIIMIMLCHTSLFFETAVIRSIYYPIKEFLKIGVDIFFLLSGLGLYYSFSKDGNVVHFYKKRFRRVVPTYIVIILFWGLFAIPLSLENASSFLWRYSLLSFYTEGETSSWFVAGILVLYAVFPLVYNGIVSNKPKNRYIYIVSTCIYLISLIITLTQETDSGLRRTSEAFFVRIPTFLSGILLGKQIKEGSQIGYAMLKVMLLTCMSFTLLWLNARFNQICERWMERVLFLPLSFCLTYTIAYAVERTNLIRKPLCFLGGMTLEIYLIHEKVLLVYDTYITRCMVGSFISNASAMIMAVLVATVCVKGIGYLSLAKENVTK